MRTVYLPGLFITFVQTVTPFTSFGQSPSPASRREVQTVAPRVLKGHADEVRQVTFAPNGKMMASSSIDGTIRLWEVGAGREIKRLPPNKNYVAELEFSPDGSSLASFGRFYDDKVRLWDIANGSLRYQFHQDSSRVMRNSSLGVGLAFSPDGKTLAVAQLRSKNLVFHAADTGRISGLLEVQGWIDAFAFSPDRKTLAVTCTRTENGDTVGLWDFATGTLVCVLPKKEKHKGVPKHLVFSPDGKALAELHEGTFRLWDVDSRKQTHSFERPGTLEAVTFRSNGEILVLEGNRWPYDAFDAWNIHTGKLVQRFEVRGSELNFLRAGFSPGGKQLATAMRDGTILLWDIEPGE
jgi:WD40 repeat protein